MTMAELEAYVTGRNVCRHQGRCFVVTHDPAEVVEARERGASAHGEEYDGQFVGEIDLAGLLDFQGEPDPDDPETIRDIRPRIVLEHFRQRDGFATALQARWYREGRLA